MLSASAAPEPAAPPPAAALPAVIETCDQLASAAAVHPKTVQRRRRQMPDFQQRFDQYLEAVVAYATRGSTRESPSIVDWALVAAMVIALARRRCWKIPSLALLYFVFLIPSCIMTISSSE